MVAEVAILLRLPRHRHFFDYSFPADGSEIFAGDLIEVPFRGKFKHGIVIRTKKNSDTPNLKTVNRIVLRQFVSSQQLSLAKKIAGHYGVALGQVLSLFAPVIPNRRFVPQVVSATSASGRKSVNSWLFTYYQRKARLNQIKKLSKQVTNRGEQILILVPDISNLRVIKKYLGQGYEWHSNLTISEQQKTWSVVRSGAAQVIISTRSGLFLPFQKLGGILVDNSENENFKQSDQNPRYDSIEVACWLRDIWLCSLAMFSAAPRLDDLANIKRAGWKNISLGGTQPERVVLIDLKNKPVPDKLISPELISAILKTISAGQKVFLYYNRRGANAGVVCRDCGHLSRCRQCEKVMVWHQERKELFCHTCGLKQSLPVPCPRCHGSNVHYLGTGVTELEKKIHEFFPSKRILKIDSDNNIDVQPKEISKCDIVLGTVKAIPLLDLYDFKLVGTVSLESDLVMPDYRSIEFAWMRLRKFLACSLGLVYIQTYNPEMEWLAFISQDPMTFFEFSLKERGQFSWPPIIGLLRLTFKYTSESRVVREARKLVNELNANIGRNLAEVTGPYPDHNIKEGKKFVYHILVKYTKSFKCEKLWEFLPPDVIIDRHPRFVLS